MKKLLLLLSVLLAGGVSGAWATDITWTSTDETTGGIAAYGFGITLPEDKTDANKAYNVSSFTITLREGNQYTKALYMAIATESASASTISASKVIAISTNMSVAEAGSCTYTFKGLALFRGVTYHVHFFSTDTPTDGAFTEQQQGIMVGTKSTSNPLGTVDNTFTNQTSKWPPIFSATLNEGMLISPSTGNYTNKTSNGNWASIWTSGCKAPALQLSTAKQYIATATGAIYSGGESSTYTISVPGYLITGYKIKGQALVADYNQTITPADDSEHPVVFTSAAENTVTITGIEKASTTFTLAGANKGMSISEFRVYVKPDPSIATLVSTLKTNMTTYKALTGVGYPKSDAAARTNLNSAYSEIDSYTGSTQDYIKRINYAGQLEAYNNFLECTDIDMPEDGKVYKFTNVLQNNTTKQYVYDKDNTSTHDLALSKTPISDGTEKFVCHVINASNGEYAFVSLQSYYMVGATASGGTAMNSTYNAAKQKCTIAKHSVTGVTNAVAFGKVSIKFDERVNSTLKACLIAQDGGWGTDQGEYVNATWSTMFIMEECDDYYNKVTLTTDGTDAYASLYLPFAVTIPEGITAYAVESQNGTTAHMEEIVTDGILPAEQAAILKKGGQTTNETIYLSPAEGAGSFSGTNLLGGTVVDKTLASLGTGAAYVLAKPGEDPIGLYKYTGTDLAKGKAYLFIASGGGGVKGFTFSFGNETGINSNKDVKEAVDGPIYNLAGLRQETLQKGVNLVNGKAIIVK